MTPLTSRLRAFDLVILTSPLETHASVCGSLRLEDRLGQLFGRWDIGSKNKFLKSIERLWAFGKAHRLWVASPNVSPKVLSVI